MTVEVYKGYLVEVVDGHDILYSEFHFVDNKKEALRIGQEEKESILKQREQEDDE